MPEAAARSAGQSRESETAALIERADAAGRFVLLCDHATNRLPPRYGSLGLGVEDLGRHFAWDPGAAGIARRMAERLDAPLVLANVSRLVIDCNRSPDAPDSIVAVGEMTPIPGNADLTVPERSRRVAEAYDPFHAAVSDAIDRRAARPGSFALCAIHTFTPVMRGTRRPWHVGIIHEESNPLADAVLAALRADSGLVVGDNEPYSPADRVYHTLERHGLARGLPTVMIEVRNDLVATPEDERAWGDRLADILERVPVT